MAKRSYDMDNDNDLNIKAKAKKENISQKTIVNEAVRKYFSDISNKELLIEVKNLINKI